MQVQIDASGGQGGDALGTGDSGDGGDGASVELVNVAAPTTTSGSILFIERAFGGRGGDSSGGTVGTAGNAGCEVDFTNPGTGSVEAQLVAFGGAGGGGGSSSDGSHGGTAETGFHLVGKSAVTATVTVTGGNGGTDFAFGAEHRAGDGGAALVALLDRRKLRSL